jgi:predicted nucleic acid-binding protein
MTEAAWLLREQRESIPRLLGLLHDGLISCLDLSVADASKIAELAQKYSDIHPQLADLSLIVIAEREELTTVFTLDQRDFAIYRDRLGRPFRLLP